MAILKIEQLNFEDFNDFDACTDIFEKADATYSFDAYSLYNEREKAREMFKRYTVTINNRDAYNAFKEQIAIAIQQLNEQRRNLNYNHNENYDTMSPQEIKESDKMRDDLQKMADDMVNFFENLTIEKWFNNRLDNGMKLSKKMAKWKNKTLTDFYTTQDRSKRIVQVTINPTAQAVAGMANYADSGSWNGYQGTSCQDTRHDGEYCKHLAGALSDNRLWCIQMNHLSDNEPAFEAYQQGEEAFANYHATDNYDDLLYGDNMQDNLRARNLGRVWNMRNEFMTNYPYDDKLRDEMMDTINILRANNIDLWIMKTINFYGDNVTKTELRNALNQIAEVENILVNK